MASTCTIPEHHCCHLCSKRQSEGRHMSATPPSPLVVLVMIGAIVSHHMAHSSPVARGENHTETLQGQLAKAAAHEDGARQCKTDEACLEHDLAISNAQHILCVDSFCRCEPNYRPVGALSPEMRCEHFNCSTDDHCQEYDHHRVCEAGGACRCRAQFLEDATNGLKCVPQYGLMPAYMKKPRKYLNKNRISYREDIEHWPGHDRILWLQYFFFVAFFVCQIGYLSNYVVRRRRKMIEQMILSKNLVVRQNSDQVPIAGERLETL